MRISGVSRIEGPEGRGSGWMVRITRNGVTTHKWFADGLHGGKMKARKAAIEHRQELEASLPPPKPISERKTSRNKTGKVGVSFQDKVQARGKQKVYFQGYMAAWSTPEGSAETITFSCSKYGKRAAFKLAALAREHRTTDRQWVERRLGAARN